MNLKIIAMILAAQLGLMLFTLSSAQEIVFGGNPGVTSSNDDPDCRCVLLRECSSLFTPDLRMTLEKAAEMRRRRCGFDGTRMKVCCPDVDEIQTYEHSINTDQHSLSATSNVSETLPINCGYRNFIERIQAHGGVNANLGEHPWAVAIGYSVGGRSDQEPTLEFRCGGSLITSQHVLTAAHCVHPLAIGTSSITQLNVGELNTQTDPDCSVIGVGHRVCAPPVLVRRPAKVTWHSQYNSNRRHNNDIAVIQLDEPVEFNEYVSPICIPDSFRPDSEEYSTPIAVGWGETEKAETSEILQKIRIPFVDFEICNSSFRGLLSEHQVCAGGDAGVDTCLGDSGGPLVTTGPYGPPFMIIGLTSFGKPYCGRENHYGVYTIVPHFKEWIIATINL